MNLIVLIVEIIVIVAIAFWMFVWPRIKLTRNAKVVENEEFARLIPVAQLIDIREANLFREKHILGARNLPQSQLKESLNALSKNKPVLIYETGKPANAAKVAKALKQAGVPEIYILKNGLNDWDGKTKQG